MDITALGCWGFDSTKQHGASGKTQLGSGFSLENLHRLLITDFCRLADLQMPGKKLVIARFCHSF